MLQLRYHKLEKRRCPTSSNRMVGMRSWLTLTGALFRAFSIYHPKVKLNASMEIASLFASGAEKGRLSQDRRMMAPRQVKQRALRAASRVSLT
jgi:hypothetical protein